MLTPRHRATHYTNAGVLSHHTQYSIPTAGGAAVNMVPRDQPFVFPFPFEMDLNRLERIGALVDNEDRSTKLGRHSCLHWMARKSTLPG